MKNGTRRISWKSNADYAHNASKRFDRRGSTLVLVVAITAVAVILLAAVTTAILSANSVSSTNYKSQQAYFTARSAVSAVADYICDPLNANTRDLIYPANPGDPPKVSTGNFSGGLGWYQVTVENVTDEAAKSKGDKIIKITAIGYYPNKENGVSRTVSRYVEFLSAAHLFENLIYLNTNSPVEFGQCTLNGSIVTNNSLTFAKGVEINDNIKSGGDVSIGGGAKVTSDVTAAGNLILAGGGDISYGNVKAGGDATITGGANIRGDLTVNGNLYMSEGGSILGSVFVGKNAQFVQGRPSINGNLTVGGEVLPKDKTFVNGKVLEHQKIKKAIPEYPTAITTSIPRPDVLSNPTFYSPVTYTATEYAWGTTYLTATIMADGTLNSPDFAFGKGSALVFDTTNGDINLRIDKNSKLPKGISVSVMGPGKVYIWIDDGVTFDIDQISMSSETGEVDAQGKPIDNGTRIFIIGGNHSNLNIHNAHVEACVYLPTGTIKFSGSSLSDPVYEATMFEGSIIADNINIEHGVSLSYKKPDIKDTILDENLSSWNASNWEQGSWSGI